MMDNKFVLRSDVTLYLFVGIYIFLSLTFEFKISVLWILEFAFNRN